MQSGGGFGARGELLVRLKVALDVLLHLLVHLLLGDGLDLVELLLALALVADAVKLAAPSEAVR